METLLRTALEGLKQPFDVAHQQKAKPGDQSRGLARDVEDGALDTGRAESVTQLNFPWMKSASLKVAILFSAFVTGAVLHFGFRGAPSASTAVSKAAPFGDAVEAPEAAVDGTFNFLTPDPANLIWDEKKSMHCGDERFMSGWLSVPLMHDKYITRYEMSPRVCLRVCALPAMQQPAKLGPLMVHCGGPGSGADCAAGQLDFFELGGTNGTVRRDFDLWSIDQRGIASGSTTCPFKYPSGQPVEPHPIVECDEIRSKLEPLNRAEAKQWMEYMMGALGDLTFDTVILPIIRSGGLPNDETYGLTYRNETWVRWYYRLMKLEHNLCYASERYKIRSPISNRSLNVLHYTGTEDLANDIDVFRRAVGAEYMSIRGASYGTSVASTYATLFPEKVSRMIIDGDVTPEPDVKVKATSSAWGLESVWSGQASACDNSLMQGLAAEDLCPAAPNVESKVLEMISNTSDKSRAARTFELVYNRLFQDDVPFTSEVMCGIAELYDGKAGPGCPYQNKKLRSSEFRPDLFHYSIQAAVLGLDTAGRLTEAALVQWWRSAKELYPIGAARALVYAVGIGTWPALPRPTPPFGSTRVKPLILGNLHDPNTAYRNSQTIAEAFPEGRLMTWQGYGHCMQMPHNSRAVIDKYERERKNGQMPTYTDEVGKLLCAMIAYDYLANGTLPPDGHVCKVAGPVKVGPGHPLP